MVEDDPSTIAFMVSVFADDFDPVIVKTSEQAMELLSDDIQVVLLDLNLADSSGFEFLQSLQTREDVEDLPVVIVSASLNDSDIDRAFRLGAIDYVQKPVNGTILRAKMHTLIDLRRKTEALRFQAMVDPLTGVGNRRMFEQVFEEEWRRASRYKQSLGLLLIDIDHFKRVNDQMGHLGGDSCLRCLGDALTACFARAGERAFRFGGDEFAVILPGSRLSECVDLARVLQSHLIATSNSESIESRTSGFTLSIGCAAVVPTRSLNQSEIIESADSALYEAKNQGGRNCVRPERIAIFDDGIMQTGRRL